MARTVATPLDRSERIWRFALAAGFLGLVASIIYTGPHIHEWTTTTVVLVPIATGVAAFLAGGILGYLAVNHPKDAGSSGIDGPDDPRPFTSADGQSDSDFFDGDHIDGH